jgi:alcohol dehydrogenase class IV
VTQFHSPTKLVFGRGCLDGWTIQAKRVLLVASASLPAAVRDRDWGAGSVVTVLKPPGEPESSAVDGAAVSLKGQEFDAVVGLGGGSVLDFAKGLALVCESGQPLADYEFGKAAISRTLPLYLAPTTAGSGSELTPYAVFTNSETRRKFTLGHPGLLAVESRVDPDLLASLPTAALMAPALDAFTHCLEALLNKTGAAALIEPFSIEGLRLAWSHLAAAADGNDHEALARLSVYGGTAIAHSRTGLIHTLSVALSPHYHTAHGTLNTQVLPFALSHNLSGYGGRLAELVSHMTGKPVANDAVAAETLSTWVSGFVAPLDPGPTEGREDSIVARLLQDRGLPSVSHGEITEVSLRRLVRRICHAT